MSNECRAPLRKRDGTVTAYTLVDVIAARDKAARELHGEFAALNSEGAA